MRVFSFARESTRYCNYSKDKFGNEITCIIPDWYTSDDEDSKQILFLKSLYESEQSYFDLLKSGLKPQQARAVLPFAIKSPLVMTGFLSDWKHFFKLRCAESAHPDARKLAKELLEKMYKLYPEDLKDLYDRYCGKEE